jgi:transcriptional regulator with XRE-family HTH domain
MRENRTSDRFMSPVKPAFSCQGHARLVDDQRVGTALRQVRIRRGLRQSDVARLARVSQSTVSRLERGHFGSVSLDALRSVAAVLEVRVDLVPRWRAGDLDRLLNASHSQLHELVARHFGKVHGWLTRPEVSFAIFAERGIVDILAYNPAAEALLVIELKTDIADVNELVGTVDRKGRLAIRIARNAGIAVSARATVSVWVIVADSRTNRRRIAAHHSMLRAAFPIDGRVMGSWLRAPRGEVRALSIWPNSHARTTGHGLRSVRRVRPPQGGARNARPSAP